MVHRRPITILSAAAVPLVALAAAGCGSSSNGSATAAGPAPTTAASAPATTAVRQTATVQVAKNAKLGKILVDSRGHTLYLFKKDRGTKSACSGMCAQFWPPLRTSGKPTVGAGLRASLVRTVKRSDGKPQVIYNGHPLYTFVMDKKRGDTKGQAFTAFGAKWFAVTASGKQAAANSASAAPKPAAPSNPIPQNNGGDGDADNNGGPSDGDGNI